MDDPGMRVQSVGPGRGTAAEDGHATSRPPIMSLYDTRPTSPFHRPSWRWDRASILVTSGRRIVGRDKEPGVVRCAAFLRDLRAASTPRKRAGVERRHPSLAAAYAVYEAGGDARVVLEARLLSGQSDAEVAIATGLDQAVVAAFEAAFFAVRGPVAAGMSDWLLMRACGHTPGSMSVASPAVLLRLLGYFCGPFDLEQALPFLTGGHDVWADHLPAGMDPELGRSIRRALRLYLLPDTPETRGRVLRAAAIVIAAEARGEVADVEGILFGPAGVSVGTLPGRISTTAATPPVGRTAATASLLHNFEGAANGMGDEEAHDEGVLLHGPSGGAEGRETVLRVRGSGTGCGPTGRGAASRAEAGSPGVAGTAGADPAGRSPARPAVRGGDGAGRGDVVRGRIPATGQTWVEEVA